MVLCGLGLLLSSQLAMGGEEEAKKVKVMIVGLDLATLAKQVERVTKKSFLFDDNALRNKKVSLQSETPITPEEFYRVFQAVCQMNDLALVPVEGAGMDLVKIVKAQGAFKEPGARPVMVSGEPIPGDDSLLSYLVKLKCASSQKILAILTANLSPIGTATQVPNTDLLLINDVASSVKRAEKIIALLDVPGEPVTSVGVGLKCVSVEKAQAMLQEHWQALAKASGAEASRDKLAIVKDERLGILHLIGTEKDVTQAQVFLKAIDVDAPAAKRMVRYYRLKNVPVRDIVDYVAQLLGASLATRESTLTQPANLGAAGRVGPAPAPAPVAAPAAAPLAGPTVTPAGAGLMAPAVAPAPAPAAGPNVAPRAAGAAMRNLPPGVELIPVEGLNTLVVVGEPPVHQEVESILENLDRRKGQVLIEVAIVQVTGNDTLDLGVEYLITNDSPGRRAKADVGLGSDIGKQGDPKSRGFPSQTTLGNISGLAFRYVRNDQLQVILSALASKGNVGIASQPLLLVNDNEEASFSTKVSQPTTTVSQGTATTNTSFGGFADATTSVKITPHISPDGYVNLEINQTFEEFQGSSPGAGIPPPKVSNTTSTKVTIPDKQTIVIGGFTRDSAEDTRSGIPGLMQIPGLGRLFSKETKTKTASRLYLFVRPKILAMAGFEDLQQESGKKKTDLDQLTRKSRIRNEIDERVGKKDETGPILPLRVPEEEKARE
jgi:general secretion pathway protein D